MPETQPAERPLRIAIVGAGPSGFYAAEALLARAKRRIVCDLFDRLPFPYGLVRGGVAPDHQNIKGVVRVYEKIVAHPDCSFYGNVKLGRDLSVQDLRDHFDAIVYALGSESDRKMGLPGEHLPGCHSATEFVGWYNGHPDFAGRTFDLSAESAVVVGIGNVAMDVARILARDPEALAGSDIAGYALEALRRKRITRVYLVGRRGAAQAAFSPKEIKEIGGLPGVDLLVHEEDLADVAGADPAQAGWDMPTRMNVEYLLERAKAGVSGAARQVDLLLCRSPVEFVAGPDGKLAQVRLEVNKLEADSSGYVNAVGTGVFETLDAGLVLKAVGYRGVPVPGVPYDMRRGMVPNVDGRVVEDFKDKKARPGEYVVGWAKRGPSGLIGTNKGDAIATVEKLLEDFDSATPPHRAARPGTEQIEAFLTARGVRFLSFADWKRIDEEEKRRGQAQGKIREKFVHIDEVLAFLDGSKPKG